jgi:hypothetical protein
MEFLKAACDAEDRGGMATHEGNIGHAEMGIGDTIVMLTDASTAGSVIGPMPATVVVYVEDADKSYHVRSRRARPLFASRWTCSTATGAPVSRIRSATTGGSIHTHIEDVSEEEIFAAGQGAAGLVAVA